MTLTLRTLFSDFLLIAFDLQRQLSVEFNLIFYLFINKIEDHASTSLTAGYHPYFKIIIPSILRFPLFPCEGK